MENKNRCMMCSYFKVEDGVLPDFGTCTKNNFEVVSSDLACGDFDYAMCVKCNNYKPCEFDNYHGYCQKDSKGNKVPYGRAICDKFKPKEDQKCCCGTYPFGNDEDKVLKYCANDVVTVAEIAARQKEKELENKVKELEENIEALKSDIGLKNAELSTMRFTRMKDDKRWREVNDKFWIPLAKVLYGTTKVNKRTDDVLNDISELKERADGNYKASIRKDALIRSLRNENKTREEENKKLKSKFDEINDINSGIIADITTEKERLQWRNDNQSKMIQDLKKERDELKEKVEVLDKRNTNQSVIIGEKGKEIENLKKKNREWQIRYNDLLFQEKLNKSAFGYDYEEENSKLRVENERLRNQLKYYPTYSALKAEDKIEHIQKEAKKWKNKYKEAYDILETYFKYDLVGMEYDVSYDELNLRLSYSTPNGDKTNKYNALTSAYERLKKL